MEFDLPYHCPNTIMEIVFVPKLQGILTRPEAGTKIQLT